MRKLLQQFIDHGKRRNLKPPTLNDYLRTIGEFFHFIENNHPDITTINDITRDIIIRYEKYLVIKIDGRGKPISLPRRKRHLTNLRRFFTFLEKENIITSNPTVNIALPKEKKTIIKDVLTIEEMNTLLKTCKANTPKSIRDRAIMELLYSTAIRGDELCNIHMKDIDLNENILFVRKGKWDSERKVPFGNKANFWVTRYIQKVRPLIHNSSSQLLFTSMTGNKLEPQVLLDIVKCWGKKANIKKNITTHTFRHSCATHMLQRKADIRYIQKQLGHKRITTTEGYLKIEISDLKEVHKRCHPREQSGW